MTWAKPCLCLKLLLFIWHRHHGSGKIHPENSEDRCCQCSKNIGCEHIVLSVRNSLLKLLQHNTRVNWATNYSLIEILNLAKAMSPVGDCVIYLVSLYICSPLLIPNYGRYLSFLPHTNSRILSLWSCYKGSSNYIFPQNLKPQKSNPSQNIWRGKAMF